MRVILLALLLTVPVDAAVSVRPGNAKPACEPFEDQRELRFRVPTASVTAHVVPGSVVEDAPDFPEAGQQLVFGTAQLETNGPQTRKLFINYAYWRGGECGGWEPARGSNWRFDLHDDKAKDGSLRVMRFLSEATGLR